MHRQSAHPGPLIEAFTASIGKQTAKDSEQKDGSNLALAHEALLAAAG
ncbi:hypothetical protein ACVIGB_001613 [Bradyrhizobium sp. USDA 4341]